MNETTFTRQIMQNWQRQMPSEFWWWKVPDYVRPGSHYSNDRAVDVLMCWKGMFVGLEWKLKKDNRAFPIKRIRLGQIQTLLAIEMAGGIGLLMVGVYKTALDKCVYAIPVQRWQTAVEARQSAGCKSIRIEEVFADCLLNRYRLQSLVHWETRLLGIMTTNKKAENRHKKWSNNAAK